MNCRNVLHSLSAYMDGELRGGEHRLVYEHLSQCKECAAEYQELLQMKRMLGQMRLQLPHDDLSNLILQRVADEEYRLTELRPGSWLHRLQTLMHDAIPTPRPILLGTGLGVALAFVLSLQVELPEDKFDWHTRDMTQAAVLPTDLAAPATVMENRPGMDWSPSDHFQPMRAGTMSTIAPPTYLPVSNMSPYAPISCEEIDARRGWHQRPQMY